MNAMRENFGVDHTATRLIAVLSAVRAALAGTVTAEWTASSEVLTTLLQACVELAGGRLPQACVLRSSTEPLTLLECRFMAGQLQWRLSRSESDPTSSAVGHALADLGDAPLDLRCGELIVDRLREVLSPAGHLHPQLVRRRSRRPLPGLAPAVLPPDLSVGEARALCAAADADTRARREATVAEPWT